MERLGIWSGFVRLVQTAPSFDAGIQGFAKLKEEAAQTYKARALDAHPDTGGSTEEMQLLNADWALLKKVDLTPPAPRQQVTFIRVQHFGGGFTTSSTSTSYTSSTGGGWW